MTGFVLGEGELAAKPLSPINPLSRLKDMLLTTYAFKFILIG